MRMVQPPQGGSLISKFRNKEEGNVRGKGRYARREAVAGVVQDPLTPINGRLAGRAFLFVTSLKTRASLGCISGRSSHSVFSKSRWIPVINSGS